MNPQPDDTSLSSDDTSSSGKSAELADPYLGYLLDKKYKMVELLGVGGWSNVYKAEHLSIGSFVAVKIMHRHLAKDDASRKRLEQEAKLLSKLDHQNVVAVIDYGIDPVPYIVVDYIDAIPLSQWIKENGAMKWQLAIELFLQVCGGLSAAHALGLVHRDLKPANILIRIEGAKVKSKILDFGIAKLVDDAIGKEKMTATGEILGSPPYMAPEQWSGESDQRTDYYAFGCIMYETLTGKPVFSAQYGIDYLNMHVSSKPPTMKKSSPRIKVPPALENIVSKCLLKQPADRYQSGDELKSDLMQVKAGLPVLIPLSEEEKREARAKRRNTIFAALSLATLSLFVFLFFQRESIWAFYCDATNSHPDLEQRIRLYNVEAISAKSKTSESGGLDKQGLSFDSELLGSSIIYDGTLMNLGAPNSPDAWSGIAVPLSGRGNTLKMLALGLNGYQKSQAFIVNYTDGSSQSFSQDLSDWIKPEKFKGENVIYSASRCVDKNGVEQIRRVNLYGYSFPLDSNKTVRNILLPSNREVVVMSLAISDTSKGQRSAADSSPMGCTPVCLNYLGQPALTFYNEIVPKKSVPGTAFGVCAWKQGLVSLLHETDGRKMFGVKLSAANAGGGNGLDVSYHDPKSRLNSSPNQCRLEYDFDWQVDQKYKFAVSSESTNKGVIYSIYFAAAPDYKWCLLMTCCNHTQMKPFSFYQSYIDDFRGDSYSSKQVRSAEFMNGWLKLKSGAWEPLSRANFFYPRSVRADFEGVSQNDKFFVSTGGQTRKQISARPYLDVVPSSKAPDFQEGK